MAAPRVILTPLRSLHLALMLCTSNWHCEWCVRVRHAPHLRNSFLPSRQGAKAEPRMQHGMFVA